MGIEEERSCGLRLHEDFQEEMSVIKQSRQTLTLFIILFIILFMKRIGCLDSGFVYFIGNDREQTCCYATHHR